MLFAEREDRVGESVVLLTEAVLAVRRLARVQVGCGERNDGGIHGEGLESPFEEPGVINV